MYSWSRPKIPNTLQGPGIMSVQICPVFSSKSMSHTFPKDDFLSLIYDLLCKIILHFPKGLLFQAAHLCLRDLNLFCYFHLRFSFKITHILPKMAPVIFPLLLCNEYPYRFYFERFLQIPKRYEVEIDSPLIS